MQLEQKICAIFSNLLEAPLNLFLVHVYWEIASHDTGSDIRVSFKNIPALLHFILAQ